VLASSQYQLAYSVFANPTKNVNQLGKRQHFYSIPSIAKGIKSVVGFHRACRKGDGGVTMAVL